MLFLLAMLAASGATPTAAGLTERSAQPVHSCMPHGVTFAQLTARSHGLRRLGEEPPANEYLAVVRQVGGCPEPAVVRTGIRR